VKRTPTATDRLRRLLDELECRVDVDAEAARDELHRRALAYETVQRLPVVVMCSEPPSEERRPYPVSEAVRDPEKMLFNELVSAWETSIAGRHEIGDDLPATVRANFGTCLVPSCFGAAVDQPDDDPAWVRHFESAEAFDLAIAQGPNLSSSHVERAVETMELYRQVLSEYEQLSRVVKVTIPDLQGPLDNAAMLRGSEIFLDIATEPERFRSALEAVSDAQVELRRRFSALAWNEPAGHVHQHGVLVRGNMLLRNDSSVMLSPQMYREQVGPFDEAVMNAVGGGAIHSCGTIDHVVPEYLEHASIRTIDFGQSWMNDVDAAYERASALKVALVRVRAERDELEDASVLDRFPTGVVLTYAAGRVDEARRTLDRYREAAAMERADNDG
jgi:hypothetical protein